MQKAYRISSVRLNCSESYEQFFHLLKYINTDVCLQINVRIIIHENRC